MSNSAQRLGFYLDEPPGEMGDAGKEKERGRVDRAPLERQPRAAESGMSTPERRSSIEEAGKRSRTSTASSGCASCGGARGEGNASSISSSSTTHSNGNHQQSHSGQLQRANRPSPILFKDALAAKLSTNECICVPPVLLSPVLSRPVRSQSAASSPLPNRNIGSDSDGDLNVVWRLPSAARRSNERSGGSRTNTPTMSPILNRSTSASKLAASFAANRSSSGSGLLSARVLLRRTDSDAADARRRRKGTRRRPSFMSHGMCSETSMDSCSSSSTNLTKMRLSLGHSDPQISASSMHHGGGATAASGSVTAGTALPAIRMRKDVLSLSQRGARHTNARRSLNTSTSPVLAPRCKSPHRQLLPTAGPSSSSSNNAAAVAGPSRTTAPVPLRSYSTRSGSSLMAPSHDNRRWSLASLPSTSGYGTPGSNSAFSSQYSSSEQLCEMVDVMRLAGVATGGQRFDSNDSSATDDPFGASAAAAAAAGGLGFRPRSRSLTSPVRLGGTEWTADVVSRNSVYKERFPRAKQQMEEKLASFVAQNAPLSGGPNVGTADETEELSGRSSRRSMVLTAETTLDPSLLRLIADGATRFLHHQLVEIASDCLQRSRDDTITCSYFCEMSQRLDETLNEAMQKTSGESFEYLNRLVKQLLMIVSRPARLLECLEFDPDEFYHLLEEAEGVVREQLGSGTARVPDLPQYIIGKLGLDRDPLLESEQGGAGSTGSPPSTPALLVHDVGACDGSGQQGEKWPQQRAPCEEDLETIRLVSNGAYGAVYLVRHRETRQRFALKKMNKQTLMLRNQIDQVFAERDILTMTDNPFVVSFYGSFETRHHLCMLMEYVEGGDCASLLKNAGTLPVDLARLYVAETILAIEYLHSYGVVHRDLKPDNLLITAMGHIKLTDFGLSKIGLMNRTTLVAEGFDIPESQQFKDKQLCGTPEYIAPEVILRQGYGKPVDWWALGIICYEFLVGIVPFFGESPEDLFSKVISEEVDYPEGDEALLPAAKSLMRQLLEKNPMERLGSVTGAAELMAHEFFHGLDFNSLLRQKAEFVPQLENEEDTSYFDSRTDRYNHDAESCGEDDGGASAPMFHSFSTASPRHSIVGLEPGPLLPPERIAACISPLSHEGDTISPSPSPSSLSRPTPSPSGTARRTCASAQSSEDHSGTDSMNDMQDKYACPMPSAVLLRRRFSAQRQSNLSTSSSGTTGTGGNVGTAPSSTDSSMDAFAFSERRHTHGEEGRLRTDSTSTVASSISRRSPLPRFAISCDPDEEHATSSHSSLPGCSTKQPPQQSHELSPVDEGVVRPRSAQDRLPGSLQLVIPTGSSSSSANTPTSVCLGGQLSPGAASATSSTSSYEGGHMQDGSVPLSPAAMGGGLKAPVLIKKGPSGFGFTIKSVRVYLAEQSDYYTIEHLVSSVDEGGPAFEAGLRSEDMITHVNGQPVHNMTHPQLMNLMLGTGTEISLKVTPLSATGIREGGPRKSVGKLAKKKPKCPKRRLPCEKKPRKPSSLLRRLSGKRNANDIVPGSSSQKQTFMPRSVSSQDGAILQQQPSCSSSGSGHHHVPVYGPGGTIPGGPPTMQPQATVPSAVTSLPSGPAHKRMSDVGLREDHRSPLVAGVPLGASPSSAFSSVHATTSSSSSSTQSPSSTRPSTLTGLKLKAPMSRPIPMVLPMERGGNGMERNGIEGRDARQTIATSPIPVSPLARQPSPSRPTSPRPSTNTTTAPVHGPHQTPSAPAVPQERPVPPPIPPPPASRNLMHRLLHKD